jgi:hypothetical protein
LRPWLERPDKADDPTFTHFCGERFFWTDLFLVDFLVLGTQIFTPLTSITVQLGLSITTALPTTRCFLLEERFVVLLDLDLVAAFLAGCFISGPFPILRSNSNKAVRRWHHSSPTSSNH